MSNGIYDYVEDVKKRLELKDQRIAELEEQLKNLKEKYVSMINENVIAFNKLEKELENAIVPKFKIGQEVWNIWSPIRIENHLIDTIHIYRGGKIGYGLDDNFGVYWEHELFATKEEAQAKLKELQGE